VDALTFLDRAERSLSPQALFVLAGDEAFLKRHAQAVLRRRLLGPDAADFALSVYPGDKASYSAVVNDLSTLPFLAPRRLVVVENADPFVTAERARLEKYLAAPSDVGVLVLEVASWPATTRLAKLVPDAATIVCKAPATQRLPEWCVRWAEAQQGKPIAAAAAKLLVQLVGPDMGLLDQELAKLAVYVGDAAKIDSKDVDRLVGNNREEKTWAVFDLIGEGRGGAALALLDRLFEQGEDAMRLLGAFSMQLRRLAQAARLSALGKSVREALNEAGVPSFGHRAAEQQMRHLGRRRLDRLYDWLLTVDQGMKGGSSLPPRTLLERLVVRLARPQDAVRPAARRPAT
jgi:DNA polymerase-3 subunit delta